MTAHVVNVLMSGIFHAAILFLVSAGLQLVFGVQKIFNVLTEHPVEVGSQAWIGGLIELVGGLAVMVGFQTRLAAFLCSGTMAVAYFQFHWKFQLDKNFLPGVNQGEMAVLYCFIFLYIACRGGGTLAIDKKGS